MPSDEVEKTVNEFWKALQKDCLSKFEVTFIDGWTINAYLPKKYQRLNKEKK